MSKKRQLLVDTALELFYHQGIHQVGINEVLAVSGVAKRTLYNHFASKDALILAALEQRHANFMHWLESLLVEAKSSKEVIDALFDGLALWFAGKAAMLGKFKGCFFINTYAEFSHIESEVAHYCTYHKQQVRKLIQSKLSEKHSSDLLNAICIMQEGAIISAQLTQNADQVCTQCKRVLHALLKAKR